MACVGSVKHPTRSNQPWELDGLYTIEKTDGIEYRGKFFCAQRIIDFVIEEAAKTDTETIEVVVSCMHGRGGVGWEGGRDTICSLGWLSHCLLFLLCVRLRPCT